ncbi:MAG: S8 family peptidase [Candidatus Melainabacteria bacterium]|nr:MAG: S8 family peptidase [Candidatus Melainabacteria bacterium]
MADEFPLLRAQMRTSRHPFRNPKAGRGKKLALPPIDADSHQEFLQSKLSALLLKVSQRTLDSRLQDATREILQVVPRDGLTIPAASLSDKDEDVRLVSQDETTGVVLIDAPNAQLEFLKKKLKDYIDPNKLTKKNNRKNEPLIVPIMDIDLAGVKERSNDELRLLIDEASSTEPMWLEIACRGGHRCAPQDSINSKNQIQTAIEVLGIETIVEEFEAAERIWFFLKLSISELLLLTELVDCVYEIDLASSEVRDLVTLKELDDQSALKNLNRFSVSKPAKLAPAVVLVDTGIASNHPMLKDFVLTTSSALPEDASPIDTNGHGTSMAGLSLYRDMGGAIRQNSVIGEHWLQSVKIFNQRGIGSNSEKNRHYWPQLAVEAVDLAEKSDEEERPRVFVTTVTAPIKAPGETSWSTAINQLCYNNGLGRLFIVSIGNAPTDRVPHVHGYPQTNLGEKIDDPAQSVNALTVGALTHKTKVPVKDYPGHKSVAQTGEVSPHSRCGYPQHPIKPELVLEGGNVAFDGKVPDPMVPTLTQISTGRNFTRTPIVLMHGTSAAAANAAFFAANLRRTHPHLKAETIRALMVHSAEWSETMMAQAPVKDDRLALFGYGEPNFQYAERCARERATVVIEGSMPNAFLDKDKMTCSPFFEPVKKLDSFTW